MVPSHPAGRPVSKRTGLVEIDGPFYEQRLQIRLQSASAEVLMIMIVAGDNLNLFDPAQATTKVKNDRDIPEIINLLLDKHRLRNFKPEDKKNLVIKYETGYH